MKLNIQYFNLGGMLTPKPIIKIIFNGLDERNSILINLKKNIKEKLNNYNVKFEKNLINDDKNIYIIFDFLDSYSFEQIIELSEKNTFIIPLNINGSQVLLENSFREINDKIIPYWRPILDLDDWEELKDKYSNKLYDFFKEFDDIYPRDRIIEIVINILYLINDEIIISNDFIKNSINTFATNLTSSTSSTSSTSLFPSQETLVLNFIPSKSSSEPLTSSTNKQTDIDIQKDYEYAQRLDIIGPSREDGKKKQQEKIDYQIAIELQKEIDKEDQIEKKKNLDGKAKIKNQNFQAALELQKKLDKEKIDQQNLEEDKNFQAALELQQKLDKEKLDQQKLEEDKNFQAALELQQELDQEDRQIAKDKQIVKDEEMAYLQDQELRNPNIDDSTNLPQYNPKRVFNNEDYKPLNNKPPSNTYSYYYMPPLAEAYFIINNQTVPQNILNKAGRIINTGLINQENYNKLIDAIVNYLESSDEIKRSFLAAFDQSGESRPNVNYEGHISGPNQIKFLKDAKIIGNTTIKYLYLNREKNKLMLSSVTGKDGTNVHSILELIIINYEAKNKF